MYDKTHYNKKKKRKKILCVNVNQYIREVHSDIKWCYICYMYLDILVQEKYPFNSPPPTKDE